MTQRDVVVIDYGVGNLLSVKRGLERCGATVFLTADRKKILDAKRVVLPGVGAFANAMQALIRLDLVEVIRELAHRETPILGICLGMQLLLEQSDEFGVNAGLGLIPGNVISVPTIDLYGLKQKIPHIGWNSLILSRNSVDWGKTLLEEVSPGEAAYFTHSYMSVPKDQADRISDCLYGGHRIAAVIKKGKITGCQFHPEKSGQVGLKILKRFCFE